MPQKVVDLRKLRLVSKVRMHLTGELYPLAVRAQKHLSAVHSRRGKVPHDRLVIIRQPQNDYRSACLIFAQKAACLAAYDKCGLLFLVRLHMYSCTVACVAAHIYVTAAHRVADRVTDISVYNDSAVIHRVTDRVLRISHDLYLCTVEIRTQRVARDTADGHSLIRDACR